MRRYFLLPFHGTTLLLVATFTLASIPVANGGLLAIPLAVILLSWFFKYCFVLLDSIIAGSETPPVLSIEMVNPLDEQRPVARAAIIVVAILLVRAIFDHLGRVAGLVTASVLLFELPASVAVLGMTRNPFLAVWPPEIWAITRVCGREYVLINAAMLAAAILIYSLLYPVEPIWLTVALAQWWFLFAFSLVGGGSVRASPGARDRQPHQSGARSRTHRAGAFPGTQSDIG